MCNDGACSKVKNLERMCCVLHDWSSVSKKQMQPDVWQHADKLFSFRRGCCARLSSAPVRSSIPITQSALSVIFLRRLWRIYNVEIYARESLAKGPFFTTLYRSVWIFHVAVSSAHWLCLYIYIYKYSNIILAINLDPRPQYSGPATASGVSVDICCTDDIGRRLVIGRLSMESMHATCLAVALNDSGQSRVITFFPGNVCCFRAADEIRRAQSKKFPNDISH